MWTWTDPERVQRIATKRLPIVDGVKVSDRQELITGYDQGAMETADVVLIGAGGIGCEMAEGLVRKGIRKETILDHDFVDRTSLNRQFFFESDIGKFKAPRLAVNLAQHATCGSELTGYALSFQDAVALGLDLSCSVVICGVDNGETRIAVSQHFWPKKIPVIYLAVDHSGEAGGIFVSEPGGPCWGCPFPKSYRGQKASCRTPACKDTLKLIAAFGLYAVDSLIMNRKRGWNLRQIHLAGFAPDVQMQIERRADCPLCHE